MSKEILTFGEIEIEKKITIIKLLFFKRCVMIKKGSHYI